MERKTYPKEHDDLEERFQISTEVSFESENVEFQGLNIMDIEVKKKVEKLKIVEIEHRKSANRNSLF
jgi:hypothetical protein